MKSCFLKVIGSSFSRPGYGFSPETKGISLLSITIGRFGNSVFNAWAFPQYGQNAHALKLLQKLFPYHKNYEQHTLPFGVII